MTSPDGEEIFDYDSYDTFQESSLNQGIPNSFGRDVQMLLATTARIADLRSPSAGSAAYWIRIDNWRREVFASFEDWNVFDELDWEYNRTAGRGEPTDVDVEVGLGWYKPRDRPRSDDPELKASGQPDTRNFPAMTLKLLHEEIRSVVDFHLHLLADFKAGRHRREDGPPVIPWKPALKMAGTVLKSMLDLLEDLTPWIKHFLTVANEVIEMTTN